MRRINYRVMDILCPSIEDCDTPPIYQVKSDRGRTDSPPMCLRHATRWCDKANGIESDLATARAAQ